MRQRKAFVTIKLTGPMREAFRQFPQLDSNSNVLPLGLAQALVQNEFLRRFTFCKW